MVWMLYWMSMAATLLPCEQEAKKKQAEEAANVHLDKVLAAFRLVKNNKFAELEDMLVEGLSNVSAATSVYLLRAAHAQ